MVEKVQNGITKFWIEIIPHMRDYVTEVSPHNDGIRLQLSQVLRQHLLRSAGNESRQL